VVEQQTEAQAAAVVDQQPTQELQAATAGQVSFVFDTLILSI
jgi:hypothetical protein